MLKSAAAIVYASVFFRIMKPVFCLSLTLLKLVFYVMTNQEQMFIFWFLEIILYIFILYLDGNVCCTMLINGCRDLDERTGNSFQLQSIQTVQ